MCGDLGIYSNACPKIYWYVFSVRHGILVTPSSKVSIKWGAHFRTSLRLHLIDAFTKGLSWSIALLQALYSTEYIDHCHRGSSNAQVQLTGVHKPQ